MWLAVPEGVTSTAIRVFTREEKRGLTEQDFRGADLSEVDLSGANLQGSTFEGCCLRGCDLRAADLRAVRFLRCDLRDAQLGGARLGDNRFDGSCCARVFGLSRLQVQYVRARGGTFIDWAEAPYLAPDLE
jgi:uncharacterized protein YjbI with pentapeptide repeats